jgi:zinc protease
MAPASTLGVIAVTLAAVGPAAAAPPGLAVHATTLDNGLRVLVTEERRAPLVSVAVMYEVGARNESAGTTGLAHYAEHMNFRALEGFPGSETTEVITRIGGRWNGYTWIDQTYYAETVHRDALPHMLELEARRMKDALYDPAEFQKERTSVLAELRSYDDPRSLLYDAVLAAAFEIHPYRNNTIGWISDVEGVTRDEAHAFYRRFYGPRNAVLVIAGDVDAASALAAARAAFAGVPAGGESTAVRTLEPAQDGQRRVTVRRPGPHADLLVAFRAPALAEPGFPVLALADALLNGGRGFHFLRDYAPHPEAPLPRALVASGRATRVRTSWQASRYPYVYTIEAPVSEESGLAAAERTLFDALAEAARRPFTEDELARARRQILAGHALDLDDLATRAHQIALFEVAGGHRHLVELPARLAAVTAEDVRAFVAARLAPERATVGWFVPAPGTSSAEAKGAAPASTPGRPGAATPSAPTAPASAAISSLRAPESFTLRSGVRVKTVPLAGGLVVVRARGPAGPVAERGASAIVAELLARPAADPAAPAVQVIGGDEDGVAGRTLDLEVVALPDELPRAIEALGATLTRARKAGPDEIRAARRAAAQRAKEREGTAAAAALRRAVAEIYGASGPQWPQPAEVEAVSDVDVARVVGRALSPRALEVVAAGAIGEDVRPVLERALGAWPQAGAPPEQPAAATAKGAAAWTELLVARPEDAQNTVTVVWPVARRQAWDGAALEALLYLLGETGYAGRLGRALVDPGLVYSVYTTQDGGAEAPFLRVVTAASRADTTEVLRRMRAEIERTAGGGLTDAELSEAKAYLRGKAARARQGTRAAAEAALDEGRRAPAAAVDALTRSQLEDTARRLLSRGAPVAVVAGVRD